MKEKVCGVVVLYNPDYSVVNNIKSYITQVEILIVVDNSLHPDEKLISSIRSLSNIEYIYNGSNLGIAKALNIGATFAIEKGYKYLLTMDQDSKAPKNMVASLLDIGEKEKNVGIVSPLHTNKFNTHLRFNKSLEEVSYVMTSGNLINLNAYKRIGGFIDDYFIDYVDIEFCLRLLLNGFIILRVNSIYLEHNEADIEQKVFLSQRYYPLNHKPFRFYYKTRNLLYLRREFKNNLRALIKNLIIGYFRVVIKMVLFEKKKIEKSKMIIWGFMDYLNGKKGIRK